MKITVCFLIAAILISLMPFTGAVLSAGTTTFDMSSDVSVAKVGETFTVTVTGKNVKDLDAFEARVLFDSDKLEAIPGKIVANLKGGTVNPMVKGNTIILAYAKMGNEAKENGNLPLCSISFKIKKPGAPKVTLDSMKVLDSILAEANYTIGKTVTVFASDASTVVTAAAYDAAAKTATANVSIEDLQKAIDNTAKTIYINVLGIEEADTVIVNMPAQLLKDAQLKQGKTIRINAGIATASFTNDMLEESVINASINLQFRVSKRVDIEALSKEVKTQMDGRPSYDVSVNVDGKGINNIKGNKRIAGMEVGYSLRDGENPGKVIIYYIDSNGKLTLVKNGKYNSDTGNVDFKPQHFSIFVVGYSKITFDDLPSAAWAKDSIEALAGRGIINGTGGGRFDPAAPITRAQFIKLLMQAFDLADDDAVCTFKDVKKGEWYYSSVAAAQKLKIVSGNADGSFGINDGITRQDMAVMAYKTALLQNISLSGGPAVTQFTDKAAIASYAVEAVAAMQESGIISGVGDNRFAPKDTATRAEAAVILYRLFSKS